MSQIDKRIKVNTIIENQLPEFVVTDFPNAAEFFKQYYISQEFQGGAADLIQNFDQYLKPDNLVPEVIVGISTVNADVASTDTTITVTSTKGFPTEYGLLKINDEIISYTGITSTSFTGCIRGFSGISGYNVGISSSLLNINQEKLIFDDTTASSHITGATVTNLSVLFLQEFYKKLKRTFLPGLEDNDFSDNLDVGNFVKFARSFYQSKGIEESVRILFKVLYGVESTILDLEKNLIKPSDAEFIRREVIIADLITPTGEPQNLKGQTIFKSTDLSTNASVSEVEILKRDQKNYFKISLFVGFSDRDLIEGIFTVPGKTKSLLTTNSGESVLSVDSTVGFGTTGTIISGSNTIDYTSKSINQFFGCTGLNSTINTADEIRSDETIFGYENGDLGKRVDLRITGVLSELVPISDIKLAKEGENIFVKNVGEKIKNNGNSYKEIFANSWKYNTSSRFQVDISGTTFSFKAPIDKSNINVGDKFTILKRNEQVVVASGEVESVDFNSNQIISKQINNFIQDPNQLYDIRRNIKTVTSSEVEIKEGNNVLISDVLNVYTDGDAFGYVASNSLPNFDITTGIVTESARGDNLDGFNVFTDTYSFIDFDVQNNKDIKFIQGDPVVYKPENEVLSGLESGRTYYVDPIQPPANQTQTKVALYQSPNQIGSASTVQIGIGSTGGHTFVLEKHANRKLERDSVFRKFPLSQNLFLSSKHETPTDDIGVLIDGVQIRSPRSSNIIYFGPLESIDIFNGGRDYDVINPPSLEIENVSGNPADPVLSGSVKEVIVDPQNFDIDSVNSLSITGGNGTGCVLQAVVGIRNRFIDFDSRKLIFNGGLDVDNETITFKTDHNLESGQLVYYSSNGNNPIGITSIPYDSSNTQTGTLADGDAYFVRVVNTSTIRIFNKKEDALAGIAGINTIGISTISNAFGIHSFRTKNRKTLTSIKVLESGSGYTNRKIRVLPSGISTAFDTINFTNHGFSDGEIVEYSADNVVQGLSTATSYIVKKVDDNSFKLSNAGVGGTSTVDYDRRKYVNLTTVGSGYHIFNYPEIKVNIEVSYGSTVTGDFKFTPIITGEIIAANLYDKGSDFGSTILNHQITPKIDILTGESGEIRPVIANGKIESAAVVNQGREYFSAPEVIVTDTGSGSGAKIRPVVSGGKIVDAIVVNSGIGYSSFTTNVQIIPRGSNSVLSGRVRSLTLNDEKRFGNFNLTSRENSLNFSVFGYSQTLANSLEKDSFSETDNGQFDKITSHSPIIGWAYDGNPIYGPFGYSDVDDINSDLKIVESSYKLDSSKLENRPTGFEDGFFIDDYVFDGTGDLDIHNGRFSKTPEFPNGIYAYFTSIGIGSANNIIEGKYPYFIGKSYRSELISDNTTLSQDFDFNNSNLLRNTLPYSVDEEFADNDFIIESNEQIRQVTKIESVTKGDVNDIEILEGGSGYKVGDLTVFDNSETGGSGFSAQVDEIVGVNISKIDTAFQKFEDVVFVWNSDNEVIANKLPFIELNDNSSISVTGLNTSIVNLTGSFKIGVSTNTIGLARTMTVGNTNGKIEDIHVTDIPNTVSVEGFLKIGTEFLRVLNVFNTRKVIRVQRAVGVAGAAHTLGSNIDVLNNRISIPVKTKKFESKKNDVIFFNAPQSVGVGTTSGSAISVENVVGDVKTNIPVPTRTIHLPNHPFKTGQKVTLKIAAGLSTSIGVSTNGLVQTFRIPETFSSQDLYVINKGENYIGLLKSNVGIGSTSEGLFFHTNGTQSGIGSGLYSLQSNFDQVIGDVDKVNTTVTTVVSAGGTGHNLQEGDTIKMNVIPNLSVGIGSTESITVKYNSQFEKLLINPKTFASADVETNQIDIENHGFVTGDKVFYDGSATGLSTGSYFVNKISERYFSLTETSNDLYTTPVKVVSITANTGGANQSLSLINPKIVAAKNSKLTFSLKDTSLAGYEFKLFYNEELTNEYLSSQDSTNFNVVGVGTIGIGTNNTDPVGAALTVQFSDSTPEKLYYGISKGGFISTSDTETSNFAQIRFVDSIYNGEYKIFDVTNTTFKFSPLVPELNHYNSTDCEKLEYSTKSTNVEGAIKDFRIISPGFNYKVLPKFKSITSDNGVNANIIATSNSIGRIKNVRIVDIGYEYSSDKTLSPEAFVSPVINIDNLDVINSVNIISGGKNYVTAPNLIVLNPTTGEVVDDASLIPTAPNQSISKVDVIAPITGLDSVNHSIISINNSNGVGINSVETSLSGIVTCFLETPLNGFRDPQPFAIGDKIFVEGIQRVGETGVGATQGGISTETSVSGDGYNSENYNYQFFDVTDYIGGTQAQVKFNLSGLSTNPGIAKTFQSGYAVIVNESDYPVIQPVLTRGQFELNESLTVNNQKTDLSIVEIRDDYVKLDGTFDVVQGDRITGRSSNISADITSVIPNKARFTTNFSNRQAYGWLDDIGKLNEDYQVIPNNDYYQNLSYTVKSSVEWDKFVNPVNRLVHPAGLKNFADTSIESRVPLGVSTASTKDTIVLDVNNIIGLEDKQRVDAINNFDFVRDYERRIKSSKFLELKSKNLTDFTMCLTNRVLVHDDISDNFSSTGFQENNTVIDRLTEDFGIYLIQIIDPETFDTQLSELVTLTDTNNAYLLEKTTDFTTLELGEFSTTIDSSNIKSLIFTPEEEFEKDHDIKILKTDFTTDLTGIGTNSIGSVDLTGVNVNAGIGTTTTIATFPKDEFNGLFANILIEDTVSKQTNYNEVIVDFDGTETTTAQTYIDTIKGPSQSAVGIITARFENNLVKLQVENFTNDILNVRSNIVGLVTTTSGIGTYRFSVLGQPSATERTARFESGISSATGSTITYATISKTLDSSVKSLVRVSCGKTSAIHQIISIRDSDDILTVQYPFVSAGSTTGIGTFGGEISGNNINLRFYPDSEFDSLIQVQSFNQILYTESDFENLPPNLSYGTVDQQIYLKTYDGLSGLRANKVEFDLKYKGTPIYGKTFDPVGINSISDGVGLVKSTGVFNIPNHFFSNKEELTYIPASTFVGVAATAVSIGATTNTLGVTTDILPSTVFAKVIDENQFQLFTRKEHIASGLAVTFTGSGSGNLHKLNMTKSLSKTIIGLDGVVQQPITFTTITHTFGIFDGGTYQPNVGAGITQFVLSGISSVTTSDLLKIGDEYMTVTEVGFSSTPTGIINDATDVALGISTLPTVKVRRGQLGTTAAGISSGAIARVHRGSFNIVDSKVYFTDPPKGNTREIRDETNLPFVKADFSGRTFLRSNYDTNMVFDDISDNFTGIGKTYTLTVGGANTSAGVSIGNGILFINGVAQTPLTINNAGNNYEFTSFTSAGISTVEFTGITSTNGDFIMSDSDINQNQVPRGGIILSVGSTAGLGYAPLHGAKVKAFKNSSGGLTSIVGIGTSSGFNLGIQTALYDNASGIITVTTNTVHGFGLNKPNTVKLKNLEFSCVGYSGVTTTIFQDHERPLFLVGIVSDRTFEVQAGPSTIAHTYVGGGEAYEFFGDLNFGSGYRGGSVAIGVTDVAYEHRFVSSGIGSIKKTAFSGASSQAFTATDAKYISHTGNLILTIPNHGMTTSDTIGIDTGGLVFKCSKDDFFSNHPYPREVSKTRATHTDGVGGKDPFAGIQTGIGATTLDTVTFFVGKGGGGGTGAEVSTIVGAGGTLAFTIDNPGTGYVNPEILIPEPNYDNLPVVGVSRLGVGSTTDTGNNLLIDVEVSAAKTTVGIGSTTFEISNFKIARPGHSFKIGDKFKPVGLVTAAHLSKPINEFELEVLSIFNDKFSAWQFGEIDFIDDIKNLQDGSKTRFPLFFNGQLLSFEKDPTNAVSNLIDLDAVLLIFVNGVLQKPGESYTFDGGATFTFAEAPTGETSPGANDHDNVDIFFYKGQDGVDIDIVDVQETIKIGDELKVFKSPVGMTTSQSEERVVKDILGAKLAETNIYTGLGVDDINLKPIRWTKQKVDLIVNGEIIDKSRVSLEPAIYPTAKIIGDLTTISGVGNNDKLQSIFVDNAESFFYEEGGGDGAYIADDDKYGVNINSVDAIISSGSIGVGAAATAIVSAAGTISSFDVTNTGNGYNAATVKLAIPAVGVGTYLKTDEIDGATATVTVSAAGTISSINITNPGKRYITSPLVTILPPNLYAIGASGTVGIGSTATATASLTDGSVTSIEITGIGSGYVSSNPPAVIIEKPPAEVGIGSLATASSTVTNGSISKIDVVNTGLGYTHSNPPQVLVELPKFQTEKITSIDTVEGFTGIITGISTTTISNQSAIKFFFRATKTANSLLVGYPVLIKDTKVGAGVISVDTHNDSIVGIGTTFLDNIYKVHAITSNSEDGIITCNVKNGSDLSGITSTGFHLPTGITSSILGRLSWGRIFNATRSDDPISIGVTGLTINSGLTTFPTIQRRNYSGTSLKGLRSTGALRVFGL